MNRTNAVQAKITRPRHSQLGVGSLVVSLILLFCMTLVAFYVNRSLIFEQKTSANQYRATRAFETADAGIEWATSILNDVRLIDTSCTPGAAGATQSFRAKYLSYSAASGFSPLSTVQAGCSMSVASGNPSLSCSCPNSGSNPSLSSSTNPTFTVKFQTVDATTLPSGTPDKESVLVTSYGCTSSDPRCVPGATGTADGYQKVSVILKLRPALQSVPAATITTGGSLNLGSNASTVINTDRASNGLLVDAGGTIGTSHSFKTTTTLPGTPVKNALVTGDTSLSAVATSQDAMFESFFGTTVAQYRADTNTKVLDSTACGSATDCFSAFQAAYNAGYRAFYLTVDMQANNVDIGTLGQPVVLVTSANLKFNGGSQIWGLVYADSSVTWDPIGLGSGGLHGALVTRQSFGPNANADYIYDADTLKKVRGLTGSLLRVPGSWKDF